MKSQSGRWLRRLETGSVVVLLIAIIGAAIEIGALRNQLEDLKPQQLRSLIRDEIENMREAQSKSVEEIKIAGSERLDELSGHLSQHNKRLSELQDRMEAIADANVQHMAAYFGRRWCEYQSSRKLGKDYLNDTEFPIDLTVMTKTNRVCNLQALLDGERAARDKDVHRYGDAYCTVTVSVPPRMTYRLEATPETSSNRHEWWLERRSEGLALF